MKPVELIISNRTHDVASRFERISEDERAQAREQMASDQFNEQLARQLLCDISHSAGMPRVWAALQAAAGIASIDSIKARVTAAHDAQRREAEQHPAEDADVRQ